MQQTFIVIGPNIWGRGNTPSEALVAMKKQQAELRLPKNYIMYLVPISATVTGMGDFSWKSGDFSPIELYRVIDGKQQPAGTERVPVMKKK